MLAGSRAGNAAPGNEAATSFSMVATVLRFCPVTCGAGCIGCAGVVTLFALLATSAQLRRIPHVMHACFEWFIELQPLHGQSLEFPALACFPFRPT